MSHKLRRCFRTVACNNENFTQDLKKGERRHLAGSLTHPAANILSGKRSAGMPNAARWKRALP